MHTERDLNKVRTVQILYTACSVAKTSVCAKYSTVLRSSLQYCVIQEPASRPTVRLQFNWQPQQKMQAA